MLHEQTAGGTGSDGGAAIDPLHVLEGDIRAGPQRFQRAQAVVVLTAVWPRSRTSPFLQTLPAEYIRPVAVSCADCALNTQITEITSHHARLAARTL